MSKRFAKWYVYELIDPRTDTVFYVGKGSGNRIDAHERDAKKGICSKKTNKINSIEASGLKIKKQKVAFFWDEQAAYDHETDVIASYGLENLTNIMRGGQIAWDRRLLARKRKEEPKPLHEWFEKNKSEVVFSRFAEWFKAGLHTGEKQIKVTSKDPSFQFHCKISEMVYNKILPMLWEMINKCDKSKQAFAKRMKPYGVEFVNGCA